MLRAIHNILKYIMAKGHILTISLNCSVYYNDYIGLWGLQCFLNLEGYEAEVIKCLCLISLEICKQRFIISFGDAPTYIKYLEQNRAELEENGRNGLLTFSIYFVTVKKF